MTPLELVRIYAFSLIGKEYIYGGAGPHFDCSGLVIDLLKAGGIGPPHDMTAQQLFEHYKPKSQWDVHDLGSLVFYGQAINKITHIAFMISPFHIIEAGGGDSRTTTIEEARRRGAFVRMRLFKDPAGINGRKDIVAVIKPKYLDF